MCVCVCVEKNFDINKPFIFEFGIVAKNANPLILFKIPFILG